MKLLARLGRHQNEPCRRDREGAHHYRRTGKASASGKDHWRWQFV